MAWTGHDHLIDGAEVLHRVDDVHDTAAAAATQHLKALEPKNRPATHLAIENDFH